MLTPRLLPLLFKWMPVFSLFSVAIDLITLPSRTCHSRSINSGNRFTEFSNNGVRVNTYFQGQPRCGQWGWQYLKCHLDDLFCVGRVAQDSQADHILSEVNTAVIILWRKPSVRKAVIELALITRGEAQACCAAPQHHAPGHCEEKFWSFPEKDSEVRTTHCQFSRVTTNSNDKY